jgi:hypothetical protein
MSLSEALTAVRSCREQAAREYGPVRAGLRKPLSETLKDEGGSPLVYETMRELARKVTDGPVDGTRTAVLIASATLEHVLDNREPVTSLSEVAKELRQHAEDAAARVASLAFRANSAEGVRRAAATAALGREDFGETMTEAFRAGGRDGILHVSITDGANRLPLGMEVPEGSSFPLRALPNHGLGLDRVRVCVSMFRGTSEDWLALEQLCGGEHFCIFLCPEWDKTALDLATDVSGVVGHVVPILPLHREGWRETFEDVAVFTGAKVFTKAPPHSGVSLTDLGLAQTVEATPERFALEGGHGAIDQIQRRVAELQERQYATGDAAEVERLSRRLCAFNGREVEILVRGATPEESAFLHDLASSTMHATRGFIAEGGVPGGGVAYANVAETIPAGGGLGVKALRIGLRAPMRELGEQSRGEAALIDPAWIVGSVIRLAGQAAAGVLERMAKGNA